MRITDRCDSGGIVQGAVALSRKETMKEVLPMKKRLKAEKVPRIISQEAES